MRGARAARVVFRKNTPVIASRAVARPRDQRGQGTTLRATVEQSADSSRSHRHRVIGRSERLRDVLDPVVVPCRRPARRQRKVYPYVIPTTYITYSRNQHQHCQLDSSSSLLLRVSFSLWVRRGQVLYSLILILVEQSLIGFSDTTLSQIRGEEGF